MHQHFSLHKINNASSFSFSPAAYSVFKFGDGAVAAEFGNTLAQEFINAYKTQIDFTKQLVVIPSPYSFIPTATFAMTVHFIYTLNRWLAQNNFAVVQQAKVHRTVTYKEDYGELDAAQRMKLIGNDSFHIDKDFLKDKTLIFLDDIKITGSHERMITKMLGEYQLNNTTYLLYFAELVNTTIHPNIENYLNYYSIKSIFNLHPIVNHTNFAINTRIVKYILNTPSETFKQFIQQQNSNFIALLYNMALGNEYHTIEAYMGNLKFVEEKYLKL
jgi:hypothetical protein